MKTFKEFLSENAYTDFLKKFKLPDESGVKKEFMNLLKKYKDISKFPKKMDIVYDDGTVLVKEAYETLTEADDFKLYADNMASYLASNPEETLKWLKKHYSSTKEMINSPDVPNISGLKS